MHTKKKQKKTYPSQSSCNPLDAIIIPMCTKPRACSKFRAAKPTQQISRLAKPARHLVIQMQI